MNIGIITGASSGMGKEFVKLTMQNHLELDEIWVIARRKERLEAWSDLYKEQKFRILPLDLQKKEDMDYLGKTLEEVQPHIELFIHCAGFGIMGRIQEISMEEQAEMVDVNCRSVVEVSSLVLPYMKYRGRMIYMASAAAFLPQPGFAVYAASKAFVLSYVRALRAESREKQLRVTAVCPGAVKTEFFNRALTKKHLQAYKKLVMADPKKVEECVEKTGIGFMFAQLFNKSMRYVGQARSEMGIRTVFNILGPLANPSRAKNMVVGVYSPSLTEKVATAMSRLGVERAYVVSGEDNMDEITLTGATTVSEIRDGAVTTFTITPEQFGMKRVSLEELRGGSGGENAKITRAILDGTERGAKRDIVLLNAGATLYVGGVAESMEAGVKLAAEAIDSGAAAQKLEELVRVSNS